MPSALPPLARAALEAAARFVCLTIFALVLLTFLRDYAAPEWAIYRYSYMSPPAAWTYALFGYLMAISFFLPTRIENPSSLVLIVVCLLVMVPAGVCAIAMPQDYGPNPLLLLLTLALSFIIACAMNRGNSASPSNIRFTWREPHRLLIPGMLAVAGLLILFLIYRFRDIMSFASLDTLYEQRERGAATTLVDGYAQTYSQYVFSTGLVALGLYRKNVLIICFGILGSVINFMITAEKAGLLYPFFVISLYFMLRSSIAFFRGINFIALSFSVVIYLSTKLYKQSGIAEFSAWYFGMRTVMTPGAFIIYYLDFFSERGYTYLSHVRGFDLFIQAPVAFANDPRWPSIGTIIGEDYLGFDGLNANASFVASDGVASIGLLGVPLAVIAFGSYLKLLDKVSEGVGYLALLLLLPIALTLTNGSLFTMLTSFGGLFWIGVFHLGFKGEARAVSVSRHLPAVRKLDEHAKT